jgi:O-methyltransferase
MSEQFHVDRYPFYGVAQAIKRLLPSNTHLAFRSAYRAYLRAYNQVPSLSVLTSPPRLPGIDGWARVKLAYQLDRIRRHVLCPHSDQEILRFFELTLAIPKDTPGCLVEAGCFKGGSSAKLSLLAEITGRQLHVFDSFEGLPPNSEPHAEGLFGANLQNEFRGGAYCGALEEVRHNIQTYGAPAPCHYHKGWFDDTMPGFKEPIIGAFVDVDLVASTRTCLEHLYPLLVPGGFLLSQDGHVPLVVALLESRDFWRESLGCEPPPMQGLRTSKIVVIQKP